MAAPRRRKIVSRRRADDEGDEDYDIDDDSLTEGSVASDDHDLANDSDTSNVDEASPTSPALRKAHARAANGHAGAKASKGSGSSTRQSASQTRQLGQTTVSDTEVMMNGLSVSDKTETAQETNSEDAKGTPSATKASAPLVVSSSSAAMDQSQDNPQDRRRREHDDYRKKRDEDPAFVPNRGAFFMHDHRHAGPAANGFRPFGRGGRGRGRGGIGGPFAPTRYVLPPPSTTRIKADLASTHQPFPPADPIISTPWAHDMHEAVAEPSRSARQSAQGNQVIMDNGPPNGDGYIPTCDMSATPINRTLSTEKHIGNVQIRVYLPQLKQPIVFSAMPVMQYTKLPDHRPPLRRDKPVRISLPNYPPRYIFPATDRSFIFIPRALRPNNQQRIRGKPRSGFGSMGGFSRRTSVYGGSYYNGSQYSPSVALSRRSSIAPDMGRDYIVSPTGSAISRPPMAMDASRPVVRLPPRAEPQGLAASIHAAAPAVGQTGIYEDVQGQTHHLPQKAVHQESQATSIPMHQPRPQKTVSLENIESPTMLQNAQSYQQAFHHQVPVQISNGFNNDPHSRHGSFARHSTGTPLSQIPERAIHAAPFQPTHFSQQQAYYPPYQMVPPPQGYYYPPPNPYPAAPPAYVPGPPPTQGPVDAAQANGQPGGGPNLVAQEVNGMVYYYDASQIPQVPSYPAYPAAQGYPAANGVINVNGMATPSQDGYYYHQPGTVYYPQ